MWTIGSMVGLDKPWMLDTCLPLTPTIINAHHLHPLSLLVFPNKPHSLSHFLSPKTSHLLPLSLVPRALFPGLTPSPLAGVGAAAPAVPLASSPAASRPHFLSPSPLPGRVSSPLRLGSPPSASRRRCRRCGGRPSPLLARRCSDLVPPLRPCLGA